MNNDKCVYEFNDKDFSRRCLICKKLIKKIDLEFEDYFVLFRGNGGDTYRGCICFDCVDNFRGGKNGL